MPEKHTTTARNNGERWSLRAASTVGLASFLAVWHLVSLNYPAFILPGPAAVGAKLVDRALDGTLPAHAATTATEAVAGLLCGAAAAAAFAYPMARSRLADRLLSPLVVATQGIPLIAVAPLIFIWFGAGFGAKVLVCSINVFFPILVNVVAGLRAVPPHLHMLFRMLGARRMDTFFQLELPSALPSMFTGLRTGAALSMIGALTGEFLSSNRGLGFLINQATGLYDTALVIAAIAATVATSLAIHGAVRVVERIVLRRHGILTA